MGSGGGGANIYAAQEPGREGQGVLVAVVDTWVDPNHPDFGGRVVDEADCVGAGSAGGTPAQDAGACRDRTYQPDSCVHGTHVAGTIASASYGVAPKADILAVQVLTASSGGECSGSPGDVAAGIEFAAAHGAKVINLSLGDLVPGVFQNSSVTQAVHDAASDGAVVVFAAGNSSLPLTDDYGSNAIVVAATGPEGRLASYSDYGGSVNLAAPGGDDGADGLNSCTKSTCILSTFPNNSYGLLEGTSMAAPHVSGTAALLLAQNPARGRADVVHALEATAIPLSGAGSGLLDAAAALALEGPKSPTTATTTPTETGSPGSGGNQGGNQGGVSKGSSHQAAGTLQVGEPSTAGVLTTSPSTSGPIGVSGNGSKQPSAQSATTLSPGQVGQGGVPAQGSPGAQALTLRPSSAGASRSVLGGSRLAAGAAAAVLLMLVGAGVMSTWAGSRRRPPGRSRFRRGTRPAG